MFIIRHDDEHTRLKSYTAVTKGTTSVIKIEIEVTDRFDFSYVLGQLEKLDAKTKKVRAEKAAAAKQKPRKAEAAQRLALPAPVRALPPPKGGEA